MLVAFALALLAIAAACGSTGDDEAAGGQAGPVEPERELVGITGWLNTEPFTIADQLAQDRVVLIDFWTYTCINCIRTMPFLREWHDKYADSGLVILGVHSPEFDFEHDAGNVLAEMERLGVVWPVAQDNDFATWREFENSFWPAKYLIGVDGDVRYTHFGEGAYAETELEIRAALTEAGWDVSGIAAGSAEPERDPEAGAQTRELYGGYERNYHTRGLYAAQEEYYVGPDMVFEYEDIDTSTFERNHNQFYLQGPWRNEREAIVHARMTSDLQDYLALRFVSRSVNVVLNPPPGEPFTVVIELDGRPLAPEEAGADISWDEEGQSVIVVDSARVYAIVELPEWSDHDLRLRSNSASFAVFAFTFGNYLEGA
jgi:thiol-disulfide isomerase/thioredoxin